MKAELRHIVKEELERVMSNYGESEINDAIMRKHFIHTRNGDVYSPVSLNKGFVIGVGNDSEHINVPLDEVAFIQSAEDRFRK